MCLVVWVDASMTMEPHWIDGQSPTKPKTKEHECSTVGWLVHAGPDFIQIVQTLTTGQHAHVANIPRGMVRAIRVLDVAGELEF